MKKGKQGLYLCILRVWTVFVCVYVRQTHNTFPSCFSHLQFSLRVITPAETTSPSPNENVPMTCREGPCSLVFLFVDFVYICSCLSRAAQGSSRRSTYSWNMHGVFFPFPRPVKKAASFKEAVLAIRMALDMKDLGHPGTWRDVASHESRRVKTIAVPRMMVSPVLFFCVGVVGRRG